VPRQERLPVLLIGAPGRHGGELRFRECAGKRQKDRDAFYGAGIDEGHKLVLEAAQLRPVFRFHQGDGHVDGVDSGVLANVVRHVLAHADHGVAGAYAGGLGFAGEGAVGSEGDGEGGARQVDDTGFGVAEGYFEEELGRVVGGCQDDVGGEELGLRGEVGAEIAVGDYVDLDARTLEGHHSIGG
jgi:hypothetical protein